MVSVILSLLLLSKTRIGVVFGATLMLALSLKPGVRQRGRTRPSLLPSFPNIIVGTNIIVVGLFEKLVVFYQDA